MDGAGNSVGKSIRLISVKSGVQVPSCPHMYVISRTVHNLNGKSDTRLTFIFVYGSCKIFNHIIYIIFNWNLGNFFQPKKYSCYVNVN